jgi:hypothetical protein
MLSKDDHPRQRVARVRFFAAPSTGQRQQRERDRHDTDPDPLATAQLHPEEAVCEHRQEDQASREHRLTDRDRCERQRGHVQRERHHGNAPADAPPSRGEQIDRAAQRMAHVDIGRSDRTPVLEQEREVRCKRGEQRADEAHANLQRDVCHSGAVFGALIGLKDATPAAGAGSRQPRYALRATVAGILRVGSLPASASVIWKLVTWRSDGHDGERRASAPIPRPRPPQQARTVWRITRAERGSFATLHLCIVCRRRDATL